VSLFLVLLEHYKDILGRLDTNTNDQYGLCTTNAKTTICVCSKDVINVGSKADFICISSLFSLPLPSSNVVSIFWNTFLAVVAGGGGKVSEKGEEPIELGKLPQYSSKLPELRDVKAHKVA
jgi:hypothetical protein